MQTTLSEEVLGFRFKHFVNDWLALNSIVHRQEWEPHIRRFTQLLNALYHTKNIIDIGANFGYHTLLFSRECSENVYAFEPQVQNFELLEDNIKINNVNNVVVYKYACGDQNCDIKMPIFNVCNRTINMGDITPNIDCTTNEFSVTKSVLLDELDFPSKIDLIKLDVQGWEKKVLLGATNMLKTHKPVLIVEFEHFQLVKTDTTCKELFDFIREHDYHIFYLDYAYPSDHICVHNDNLVDFRLKFRNYIFPHTQNNDINNNVINGVYEKIVM
jgi:FkbM family methyltransferase